MALQSRYYLARHPEEHDRTDARLRERPQAVAERLQHTDPIRPAHVRDPVRLQDQPVERVAAGLQPGPGVRGRAPLRPRSESEMAAIRLRTDSECGQDCVAQSAVASGPIWRRLAVVS